MTFSDQIIQQIRDSVSISELISERVVLKRSGKNLVGLCPFHTEKTGSFVVREEEGTYHCFGCGKKGSVFNYIMETRGFTFPEAVRMLAARAGILIQDNFSQNSQERELVDNQRKVSFQIMNIVSRCYQEVLSSNDEARKYLQERGLLSETIEKYNLGFAPRSWDFIRKAVTRHIGSVSGYSKKDGKSLDELLVSLGLLKKNEKGYFDVFRERVIFPFTRSDGKVIAFGGRLIVPNDSAPKYLNSSESQLFTKGKTFFGLAQALPEIRKSQHVFLVEGYMDVVSMYQSGFTNTIACCGTALTVEQGKILSRLARRVSIIFDGDSAGKKAAAESFNSFLNTGLDVSVVTLPTDMDPDSFVKITNKTECEKYFIDAAVSAYDFFLTHNLEVASQGRGLSAATSGLVATKCSAMVAKVTNPVEKEFLMRRTAELLGVSIQSVEEIVHTISKSAQFPKKITNRVQENSISNFEQPGAQRYLEPLLDLGSGKIKKKNTEKSITNLSKPTSKPSLLEEIHRQLLIAIICEPTLVDYLQKLKEVSEEASFLKNLPKHIADFIDAIGVSGLPALTQYADNWFSSLDFRQADSFEFAEYARKLRTLLEKYSLSDQSLVEDGIKQCKTGGARPHKLIEEMEHAHKSVSLKNSIASLRLKEMGESSEQELGTIAQQKLLTKRNLDRLRNT